MENLEEKMEEVARILENIHERSKNQKNRHLVDPPVFVIGEEVWYRRPPDSATKLDTRWIGPGLVVAREGEHTYILEIDQKVFITSHASFMKHCMPDWFGSGEKRLFQHQRTVPKGKTPSAQGGDDIIFDGEVVEED